MYLFNAAQLKEIVALLTKAKKICIVPHHKPDGDALGASLALYQFLVQLNHSVKVVSPSDFPDFLRWMPGSSNVIDFLNTQKAADDALNNAELIFCLDFNEPARTEKMRDLLLQSPAKKILIDHHLAPQPFCDFTFSFPEACATSELVYHFICQAGFKHLINTQVAECLYAGIMTDSGSFRFPSMKAETHRVIADLMEAGALNYRIHENVYDNFSLDRTRFLGYCLSNKLMVLPEFRAAYFHVTKEELVRFHHQSGDTEGIVNYGLAIKGIVLSAFFCEKDDIIKISFRSKDLFSVKDLAARHFNGGGHMNAAGGRSTLSLSETVKQFEKLLPLYKDELLRCP
ncbi:MAG: bifunctional oligoribonuclease/PAP phosphatase NrnA [Bacteroidia bacterium]|nr:bifunctional oligoribonuclease/PAP phosphatase NrnA [Bacteroidia bacterium]